MKPHVASWSIFLITWMILLWTFPSLLLLIISFVCLQIWLLCIGEWRTYLKQLRWMLPFLSIILIIQLALFQDGQIVLYEHEFNLPIGDWQINISYRLTEEAFLVAITAAIQYLSFIGLWLAFTPLLPAKRVFAFGSKWFPHFMQMIYITLRTIPQMRTRVQAIQEVLASRGFEKTKGKLQIKQKINEQMPLLNAVLEEALEGSWHRAEAMMLRGYGHPQRKRSFYVEDTWSWRDLIIMICALACVASIWNPLFVIALILPLVLVRRENGGNTNAC
jgi:energy-coupling factor transporter transmembrane protein EcfT